MNKEQVLEKLNMTEQELNDKITTMAADFASVSQASGLPYIFSVAAAARFVSAMMASIGMSVSSERASEIARTLEKKFVTELNQYLTNILANQEGIMAEVHQIIKTPYEA